MRVLTGRWTAEFLAQLNIATAFISAGGITLEQGLTTSRKAVADTLNAAAAVAARRVALLDSTKFRRTALLTVARAQALDLVITDDGLDAMAIEEFRQAGVKLVVAEPLPFEVDGSAD
jgi:DeoR/GlpR family transcriptional regulator of sugar metabolism